MSDLITRLKLDHKNISKLLKLLEKQLMAFEAGEYADYQLLTDIMHYFVNYPDVYHHPHEDIIYSALKKKNIGVADEVDEITAEHRDMAVESAEILDKLIQIQGNAIFSRDEFATQLKNFISHYHAHIEKEEEDLFSPAERYLEENDWKVIDAEVVASDDPLFDRIMDDRYKQLYQIIMAEGKAGEV